MKGAWTIYNARSLRSCCVAILRDLRPFTTPTPPRTPSRGNTMEDFEMPPMQTRGTDSRWKESSESPSPASDRRPRRSRQSAIRARPNKHKSSRSSVNDGPTKKEIVCPVNDACTSIDTPSLGCSPLTSRPTPRTKAGVVSPDTQVPQRATLAETVSGLQGRYGDHCTFAATQRVAGRIATVAKSHEFDDMTRDSRLATLKDMGTSYMQTDLRLAQSRNTLTKSAKD